MVNPDSICVIRLSCLAATLAMAEQSIAATEKPWRKPPTFMFLGIEIVREPDLARKRKSVAGLRKTGYAIDAAATVAP